MKHLIVEVVIKGWCVRMQSVDLENVLKKINKQSAVSSWNGYVYQGKVAIYTVLCLINQLITRNEEISAYSVEIEGYEDFSIKYNDNIFSIHQVKSYQDKDTIGGYKASVLGLLGKSLLMPTVKEASLHTAITIKDFDVTDLISELKKYQSEKNKELNEFSKYLLFDENKFEEAWEKFIYNDETGEINVDRVVQVDEINEKIKQQIKIFFVAEESSVSSKISSENINHIFYNLVHKIENLIAESHIRKKGVNINFLQILNILRHESIFELTNETVASLLMDDLTTYFEEYCEEQGINFEIEEDKARVWNHHMNVFKKLSPDDFVYVCRKISPNISVKKGNSIDIREYKRLLDQYGVKQMLFESIFDFHHLLEKATNKNEIFIMKNKHSTNLITLILNENSKNACSKLGKDILKNLNSDEELLKLLFEVKNYINKSLNGEYKGTITEVNLDNQQMQMKEKITLPNKIKFIDLQTAKEEFKANA